MGLPATVAGVSHILPTPLLIPGHCSHDRAHTGRFSPSPLNHQIKAPPSRHLSPGPLARSLFLFSLALLVSRSPPRRALLRCAEPACLCRLSHAAAVLGLSAAPAAAANRPRMSCSAVQLAYHALVCPAPTRRIPVRNVRACLLGYRCHGRARGKLRSRAQGWYSPLAHFLLLAWPGMAEPALQCSCVLYVK